MIATVLLSSIAASIALVVVRQTVLVTRTETQRTETGRAASVVMDVQAEFERQLALDPSFYLTRVFSYERPRYCPARLGASTGRSYPWVLAAGMADASTGRPSDGLWPASCGPTWTYPDIGQAVTGYDYSTHPSRAEVYPPSGTDPRLRLVVLASVGQSESGSEIFYQRDSVGRWTLYSAGDVTMPDLSAGTLSLTPGGSAYAGGLLRLPSSDASLSHWTLGAESGFVGSATVTTDAPTLLSGSASQAGLAGFSALRPTVPNALTMPALRSSQSLLERVSCAGLAADVPANSGSGSVSKSSSRLCLRPGWTVRTASSGTVLSVPSSVRAWLLRPTLYGGDPALEVWYSTSDVPLGKRCVLGCSPWQAAASDVAAGRHPASDLAASMWRRLAPSGSNENVYLYPSSGVVGTSATTVFSHCSLRTGSSDVCGAVVPASLTVFAGSLSAPADIVIGGPIAYGSVDDPSVAAIGSPADSSALLGLVATGHIVVPFWAVANEGDTLDTVGSLVSLGAGPAVVGDPDESAGAPSARPLLTWSHTGSIAGSSLGSVAGVGDFSLGTDVRLKSQAPPSFPGFSLLPERSSSRRLNSEQICGSRLGNLDSTGVTVSTCLGVW